MLSLIDRVLIIRTEETMRDFNWRESERDRRKGAVCCPVPGCDTLTRGGRCRKHHRKKWAKFDRPHAIRR
jgi:hypothetical protein